MEAENVAGVIGGAVALLTCIGFGIKWLLEWYSGYRERRFEKEHQQRLEQDDANHKRDAARAEGEHSRENTVITRWKAIVNLQGKQIEQLLTNDARKQELLDLFARENRHCREVYARYSEWARAVTVYMKQKNTDWELEPPDEKLEDFDFDFHVRNSAQETATLKAMVKEAPVVVTPSMKELPAVYLPKPAPSQRVDHERPGG